MSKQIYLPILIVFLVVLSFFLYSQGRMDFGLKPDSPRPSDDNLLMANHNSLATLSHERAIEVGKAELERTIKFTKILKNPPVYVGSNYGDVITPYRNDAIKNILTLIRLGKIKPSDIDMLEEYQKMIQKEI